MGSARKGQKTAILYLGCFQGDDPRDQPLCHLGDMRTRLADRQARNALVFEAKGLEIGTERGQG